jgi:3-dehydroquinate synthase class II
VQNASGTVKTAAADSLVVTGKAKGGKVAEWTFAVDPKTKIRKAGKDIATTDLAAGDPVLVRYHEQAGKHVAESVMVRTVKKPVSDTPKTDTPKAEAPKKDETKK